MTKSVLVPWSGGLDSTFLIYSLLEAGDQVDALYVRIECNEDKTKRELASIENLKPFFAKYTLFNYIGESSVSPIFNNGSLSLQQPILFLMALLYAVKSHNQEVSIGYVLGDDAISFIGDISKVWNSFNGICHNGLPKITFPLSKISKAHIVNELPPEILKEVSWCETTTKPKRKKSTHTQFCDDNDCKPCRKLTYLNLKDSITEKIG